MSRRLPPANALQAFEAAARHMSFTEAARELGITQAAVSQRVRVLEHQVGQPLFVRHARGLELTEAGRGFVPAVQEAFERLITGVEEAFGPGQDAPLTIRTTPGFSTLWLAPRLPRFRAAHPEITLRLTTAVWPSDFAMDGADMEVRYGKGDWADVETLRLTEEHLTPVCSPATAERLVAPGDLANETLLHAVGFETGWPQWLTEMGYPALADRAAAVLCDTLAVVLELARRDQGIALGRSSFLGESLASGTLVAPFEHWTATDEAFYLVRPRRRMARPEAHAFWEWLAAERE